MWRCACGADAQERRAGATRKADVRWSREKDIRGKVACTMSCEKGCETKPREKRTKKTMLPNMRERCAA